MFFCFFSLNYINFKLKYLICICCTSYIVKYAYFISSMLSPMFTQKRCLRSNSLNKILKCAKIKNVFIYYLKLPEFIQY